MTDGKVVYETPIRIKDPSRPLGNHLYSLLGPGPDGKSFRWAAFGFGGQPGEGQSVDRWNDETLSRIEVVDKEGALEVASKLQTGTTMVITDFAAGPGELDSNNPDPTVRLVAAPGSSPRKGRCAGARHTRLFLLVNGIFP